jgi:large subunit ribosomal protein L21
MEIAVIKTGGKQYIVSPGKRIKIEKIEGKEGAKVNFTEVLLFATDKIIEIGKPTIKGAKVVATILKHGKGKKVVIFKYKAKKREATKKGHRQSYSEVEIKEIIAA